MMWDLHLPQCGISHAVNIELTLIICEFHISKFIYSLKFTCQAQISIRGTSAVIWRHEWSGVKFEARPVHSLSWGWTSKALPSCVSLLLEASSLFFWIFSATVFAFMRFLLTSLLQTDPKHSAEIYLVFSCVRKLCCAAWKKIGVLEKLCSSMRNRVLDHEFNVNKSTMYIT